MAVSIRLFRIYPPFCLLINIAPKHQFGMPLQMPGKLHTGHFPADQKALRKLLQLAAAPEFECVE
jgi:hypothetical protein